MNATRPDLPSDVSSSPMASSPSHPLMTMVGLGPPLEREDALVAGTLAYAEEDGAIPSSDQRTLIGFPPAPESSFEEVDGPDRTPSEPLNALPEDDDELTVVAERSQLLLQTDDETLARPEAVTKADAADLVESEPAIKLFAPTLDSLVPPSSKRALPEPPPVTPPLGSLATTSEAPWFVSVQKPKANRSRKTYALSALALGGALVVGGVALRPSTGQVLVTVGGPEDVAVSGAAVYVDGKQGCAPAPCRVTVTSGSHVIGVGAPSYRRPAEKALAVERGSEKALHFTVFPSERPATALGAAAPLPHPEPPSAEPASAAKVVSLSDLRVRSDTTRPVFGARPIATSAPVVPEKVDLNSAPADTASPSGLLTITSSPASNVVLDGRPLGPTPQEVAIAAGAHRIVFVHPTKGRRALRIETSSGKNAVASVNF